MISTTYINEIIAGAQRAAADYAYRISRQSLTGENPDALWEKLDVCINGATNLINNEGLTDHQNQVIIDKLLIRGGIVNYGTTAITFSSIVVSPATVWGNLTGPITSAGNATSVAAQTGTGSVFVMNTSPTLISPALGTPTVLVGTNITGTAASLTAGNVTTNANLTGPIASVGNATSITAQTGTTTVFAMQNSPTFTTDITTPLIIGGTAVGGKIEYRSTTGAATATAVAHSFTGGTNGATTLFSVLNNGSFGLGIAPTTTITQYIGKNMTGGVNVGGIYSIGTVQSDATTSAIYFYSEPKTAAASFTLTNSVGYMAQGTIIGAGSVVTNNIGFLAEYTMTTATNNYGFYGSIAAGTNRWNLYMGGTAQNYLAGNLGVGNTAATNIDTNVVVRTTIGSSTAATQGFLDLVINAGASTTSNIGVLQFGNYAIAGTEKRIAIIEGQLDGATNSGRLNFYTANAGSIGLGDIRMIIDSIGRVAIGGTVPTAVLHLKAGTATASTAPIKLTTGTINTVAEAGTIEYNNTFHVTNSDATRRHIVTAINATKTTAGAPYTNDGFISVNIGGTIVKIMTTA